MRKIILAAVAALSMSTGAQASWIPFVDGCVNTQKFTMEAKLDHGAIIYTTEDLNSNNIGYVKLSGSPYYTYENTYGKGIVFTETIQYDLCKIEGNRYISDISYDSYRDDSAYYTNQYSRAHLRFKDKVLAANTTKVLVKAEAKAKVEDSISTNSLMIQMLDERITQQADLDIREKHISTNEKLISLKKKKLLVRESRIQAESKYVSELRSENEDILARIVWERREQPSTFEKLRADIIN